jgi:dimethylhistidine N-methyltransferase
VNDQRLPIGYRIFNQLEEDEDGDLAQLIAGLMSPRAALSPKYFYDELGCALYGAICQLPEYYPTRTEVAIFSDHRQAIASAIGVGKQFVDLGAGDCCKAQGWIPFVMPQRYIAVDIAGPEIDRALAKMSLDFPEVEMLGLVTDFSRELKLDSVLGPDPATFFYPGSSIGNFTPEEAKAFVGRIAALCKQRKDSGLLIGVDAKKAKPLLDAAYDDALGVTAAFNRNALLHLNRRFGFDFDVMGFVHRGFFNEEAGRIEMHLEATREQTVHLNGQVRRFVAGERIHTENSYKYAPVEFETQLREAGFDSIKRWSNAKESYSVFYAAAAAR